MPEIDLERLSKLVSAKIGEDIQLTDFQKIGSGYHSDGFRVTASNGREFFLKYIKSHDLGFEFPERKVSNLLVSNGMSLRAGGNNPRPVGVLIVNDDHEMFLPEVTESSKLFHLQEFGGTGTSYSTLLENNRNKTTVDDEDRQLLSNIADKLIQIHAVKHPANDREQLDAIYNDGIRNMLIHPELSIMALSEFPDEYPVLNLEGQKEFIGLMYENIKSWGNRGDRLTALHGDFWGANIFIREDGSLFVVDFSRIPWGDPAIDVGWFIAEFLWKYHETGSPYFKELTETWLSLYEQKSGDREIRKALPLVVGWSGIVQVYPRWYPNIDSGIGTAFISHVRAILKQKEFIWDK